jgi:hypothetical protein
MTSPFATFLDSWGPHHGDIGIAWMLAMLALWGATVLLLVRISRRTPDRSQESPHQTLRRRLADGSISVEDFERRYAALAASADDASRPTTLWTRETGGPSHGPDDRAPRAADTSARPSQPLG